MNDPFQKLSEAGWRRELSPAEKAELRDWLAAHPEARVDWEAEVALSRSLARLPDAPMPSNFTARVLQAVELEKAAAQRQPILNRSWLWRSLLPKAALAAVFVGMSVMAFREAVYQKEQRFARGLKTVSAVSALPGPDILKDFDVIQQLQPTPPPDIELLALLQ